MDGEGLTSHSRDDGHDLYSVSDLMNRAIVMCTFMGEEDCGGVFRRDDRQYQFRRDVSSLQRLPDNDERYENQPGIWVQADYAGPWRTAAIWVRKPNHPTFYTNWCDPEYLRTRTGTYFTSHMNDEWRENNLN